MPSYVYKCENGHTQDVIHRMLYTTGIVCVVCDARQWRVPQPITVTWGGLAPSGGNISPQVEAHINGADRARAEFEAVHDEHEKRTAKE
jgi:hypothetical protein